MSCTLESLVEALSNDKLERAFSEILEWRKTGVLQDGVMREVYEEFKAENELEYYPLHVMEGAFLFEMADRHYSSENDFTLPYLRGNKYNPTYGDDRICKCGHPYYRHFDPFEDNDPVGCKYCSCGCFVAKTEE